VGLTDAVAGAKVLTSDEGAVLERRRLVHQNTNAAIKASATIPPTTPPAIGPALDLDLDDPDEGLEVVPGLLLLVDVLLPPVDFATPVDSGAAFLT